MPDAAKPKYEMPTRLRHFLEIFDAAIYIEHADQNRQAAPKPMAVEYVDCLPRILRKAVHDEKWYAGERGEQITYDEAYERAMKCVKAYVDELDEGALIVHSLFESVNYVLDAIDRIDTNLGEMRADIEAG